MVLKPLKSFCNLAAMFKKGTFLDAATFLPASCGFSQYNPVNEKLLNRKKSATIPMRFQSGIGAFNFTVIVLNLNLNQRVYYLRIFWTSIFFRLANNR